MKTTIGLIIIMLAPSLIFAQEFRKEETAMRFYEPTLMVGRIIPNHSEYPNIGFLQAYSLSIGRFNYKPESTWASFYNYPLTGIQLSFSQLGNRKELGNEYRIVPFIELNTRNRLHNTFLFRGSLGASYTTKYYNEMSNPNNKMLGSAFNWAFMVSVYYNLKVSKQGILRLGGGYLHSSNGHI